MKRGNHAPALILLLDAFAVVVCSTPAAAQPMRGMTYESIKSLPDFSGAWTVISEEALQRGTVPPPFRPEIAAAYGASLAREAEARRTGVAPADLGVKRWSNCTPPKFAGSNKTGVQDYFEILFTPGRVTITSELGLIRRVALDARALPADIEETNAGTSVGHWEGDTLVIETAGLSHTATFLNINSALLALGRNARVLERITLKEPGVLEIVARLSAPELLSTPVETTTLYRHYPDHVFREITTCVEGDRSFDNDSGRERFDLTPPADLPPPPSR